MVGLGRWTCYNCGFRAAEGWYFGGRMGLGSRDRRRSLYGFEGDLDM